MAGHLGHFLLFSQLFQFGSSEADQHPLHPLPGTITSVFYLALLDDLQLEALQSFLQHVKRGKPLVNHRGNRLESGKIFFDSFNGFLVRAGKKLEQITA